LRLPARFARADGRWGPPLVPARPRRVALSGVRSLTPSERRVAQLAARGLGNHEIAQTLFVTVKTIETHLGHIYAKLGITSRTALPHELDKADGSPAAPR
jgi:DNA-binding NarL/FixJ family response regulator